MNAARISRKAHKWLALVVGVQLLLWALSGFYMVVVDLDFIHGDPLVRNLAPELPAASTVQPVAAIRAGRTNIQQLALRALPGTHRPVYEITSSSGVELVDAGTGTPLSPLTQPFAIELASAYYAGSGQVRRAALLTNSASKPQELQSRPLPLWRVDFDDWLETSLYLDPATGVLVTRRHRFWRLFDFLWSLHIMDYGERSDVNNWLLRSATVLGLASAGTGLWLAFYSFSFLQRRKRAAVAELRDGGVEVSTP